ncbi:prephenate dehydratase [Hazenella coriacea]|uniref:Prephenate dehydratase n=1 Tax=Hazenella coriacea TaxID=1179467 RepID=A0A4R3L6P2_9BACL|nr:prephenate dehydratase [Hazenella coriacea]TCS93874.1 prephenate dehydratase [Hazenella coriacea]
MRVAYLGPQGSFSEEAAFQYFSTDHIDWYICDTIIEVLEAVSELKADQGFVPIENSIEGMINTTADGLLRNKLFIEAEVIFPVSMNLLVVDEGIQLDEIREVWSIYPVLAQCNEFIRSFKWKSRQFDSSSLAALAVKEYGKREVAAIASESAATLCSLHIAKRNIQDHSENRTRFFVVSKDNNTLKQQEQKNNKTMMLISSSEDHSGVLSSILNVFAALSINLTWIESRPTKKKLGTYHFFIEMESRLHETKTYKAITILEAFGYDVHVLGSYQTTNL